MELYLMRHGTAFSREINAEMPLSAVGQDQVVQIAKAMATMGHSFNAILSSPLTRALQTAKIMAEATRFPVENIEIHDSLLPGSQVETALAAIGKDYVDHSILVCGHMPLIERIAAHKMGASEALSLDFEPGSIMRLDFFSEGRRGFKMRWFLHPLHFQLLARGSVKRGASGAV